jgi:hypothetical protein
MKKTILLHPLLRDIMRITMLQSLMVGVAISFGFAREVRTQDLLDHSISIKAENKEIRKVLDQIEQAAKVRFVYSSNTIQVDRKVSVTATNRKLSEVLNMVLRPHNISYRLVGGQILLQTGNARKTDSFQNAEQSVTGRVTDEKGDGLPGVSVVEKGTQRGTVTDVEGKFSIEAAGAESVLVFSFVGYTSKEITVGNQSIIDMSLTVDSKALNEVVVIGYGAARKADLTGAVATISADKLKGKASVSYGEALVGQMAGVQVQQTNGAPGGEGLSIRIRGTGSITATQLAALCHRRLSDR